MMTSEQERKAERAAALVAVVHALTPEERIQIRGAGERLFPQMAGATVTEFLDCTEDYDYFCGENDSFVTQHEGLASAGVGLRFALDALNLLGRPLTVASVTRLLVKAGIIDDDAYDPSRDLAAVIIAAADGSYRARTSLALADGLANLGQHLDLRNVDAAEAGLRALYGKDA
jgi:hypothetical protein